MGGVVDKPRLLPVGIPHPHQQIIHSSLYSLQIRVSKRKQIRLFRLQAGNRFLDLLIFILRKRHPAQLVGFQRDLINGRKDPADPALLLHIGKTDVQKLKNQNDPGEYPDRHESMVHRNVHQDLSCFVLHHISQLLNIRKMGEASFIIKFKGSQSGKLLIQKPADAEHHKKEEIPSDIHGEFSSDPAYMKFADNRSHPLRFRRASVLAHIIRPVLP